MDAGVKAAMASVVVLSAWACARAAQGAITLWSVDPHVKVFRDTKSPPERGAIAMQAVRNEYVSAQFALRSPKRLKGVRVEPTPLRHAGGDAVIDAADVSWHFVGFIPLKKNTRSSERLRVRAAPCDVPDPLLAERTLDVPGNSTQPVWLTVRVPKAAPPGAYRGQVAVATGGTRAALGVELNVHPVTLPDARHLLMTNWFSGSRIARYYKVEPWSPAFWRLLTAYAADMAAHRMNVVYTPWTLIDVVREPNGRLTFDYTRFDRYVRLFEKAGVADRIELRHVGHFGQGGWSGREIVLTSVTAVDRKTGKRVRLAPREGLAPLLTDLQRHLDERGWLAKSMIHVADEPSLNNIASWRKASAFVHAAAPHLRRIDAIESIAFGGALEVWVPKLSHFDRWRQAYEARRGQGEFWYYICCHPYGSVYPNRFLDYPLSAVRVLHWINFAEDLVGYLHWGLASWREDAFGPPTGRLPPGDTHTIYPGKDGPLSSLRWEMQRDSAEDYELLCLLADRTAAICKRLGKAAAWVRPRRRARELCRRVVPTIADWQRDPAQIAAARQAVVNEIVALDQPPTLMVETEPAEGSTLVDGPIVVELRGVTEAGAAVRVNGREVEVRADGTFACPTRPRGEPYEIRVDAERDGKKKTAVRRFVLRK